MSMKIEIADWRFEITWDGMLCTPLERSEAKPEAESNGSRHSRRQPNNGNINNHSLLKLAQASNAGVAVSGNTLIGKRRETK